MKSGLRFCGFRLAHPNRSASALNIKMPFIIAQTIKITLLVTLVTITSVCFFQTQRSLAQRSNGDDLKRQNELLKRHFGFEIPITAKITNKLVTKESKVTYLFVELPASDLADFEKTSFKEVNSSTRRFDFGQYTGWLPDSDLADEPKDFIANWKKSNNISLGVLGRILSTGGRAKHAVIFVDEKGYLLIKYKK